MSDLLYMYHGNILKLLLHRHYVFFYLFQGDNEVEK